jgi:hypothetical protein
MRDNRIAVDFKLICAARNTPGPLKSKEPILKRDTPGYVSGISIHISRMNPHRTVKRFSTSLASKWAAITSITEMASADNKMTKLLDKAITNE